MMAFIQYTMQIIFSFLFFFMMFVIIPRTAVSADRIVQVLETEISVKDSEQTVALNKNTASFLIAKVFTMRFTTANSRVKGYKNNE